MDSFNLETFNSDSNLLSYSDYYKNSRKITLNECLLTKQKIEELQFIDENKTIKMITIKTKGNENIVGSFPNFNILYKHVFLQTGNFKKEIIDYYYKLGFKWVDIVPLNKIDWKIFIHI